MLPTTGLLPPAYIAWCRRWLGAEPAHVLFRVRHISTVTGLRLVDGREVVLKVRPAAPRLHACFEVQQQLCAAGFPCPRPLAGPASLGRMLATAERFVPGGTRLPRGRDSARLFAAALARLVTLAPPPAALPTLEPPPYWMWWDHDLDGTWPADPDVDLNDHEGPAWLDDLAARARRRLVHAVLPPVVGHGDWESQNLRWQGRRLHVVHDWDSVVVRPEAAIAGAAAIVFPASGTVHEQATVAQSTDFLEAYAAGRGRPFNSEEQEVAWAAGLWLQAYKAKKGTVTGSGQHLLEPLAQEAEVRLRRAGA